MICSSSSVIGIRVTPSMPSAAAAKRIFSIQHQIEANSFNELKQVGCIKGSLNLKNGKIKQAEL